MTDARNKARNKDRLTPDKTISSRSNPLVQEWVESLTSKGIRKHGAFLVSGEHGVRELLERSHQLVRSLFLCSERHVPDGKWNSLIARARELTQNTEPRFSVIALAPSIFDELDVSGTHSPLLLMRTPETPAADLSLAPVGLELMCALGDPSNVGALLRSAAAFAATRIILLKESASPFHPKSIRAASASTLLTPIFRGPSIRELPEMAARGGLRGAVLALDMKGQSLHTFEWPQNARLLLGEEGQGVPHSPTFSLLSIPMAKDVESLNATVAASIALYSYSQRTARQMTNQL